MARIKTIKYNGDYLDVTFDYQPEEKPTRDYPGCAEEVEVQEVIYKGVDIYPIISDDMMYDIEHKLSSDE